jgi:hypothetical protein
MSIIIDLIPNYSQQDATFLDLFISTDALHVSGGFSAHRQEQKLYIQLQVLSTSIAASAIMDEMELCSISSTIAASNSIG